MRVVSLFDPWNSPLCTCKTKYSLSPYTGCCYGCVYCYASSYQPNFSLVREKKDFIKRLGKDLSGLRAEKNKTIVLSASNDPYPPVEKQKKLTRKTLELLGQYGFKTLIMTKADFFDRDKKILAETGTVVSVSVTTLEKALAKKLEPNAPEPIKRLKALEKTIKAGAYGVVRIDPVIPGLNHRVEKLVEKCAEIGVKHVTSSTFKPRSDSWERFEKNFPDQSEILGSLFVEKKQNAAYLEKNLRLKTMMLVKNVCEKNGLSFGSCREGFPKLNQGSCNGLHLGGCGKK